MRRFLRWLRDIVPVVVLVIVAAAGAGFAWLTAHPETPWLEDAETWPAVGPLATKFRRAYLGPDADETSTKTVAEQKEPAEGSPFGEQASGGKGRTKEATAGKGAGSRKSRSATTEAPSDSSAGPGSAPGGSSSSRTAPRAPKLAPQEPGARTGTQRAPRSGRVLTQEELVRRRARSPIPFVALEWRWFLPGSPLRTTPPGAVAEDAGTLESMAYLPVVATEGPASQIVYRGERYWTVKGWQPPFDRKKARRGLARSRAEPISSSDTTRLRKAQKILGLDKKDADRKLGAYSLYTDVEDEDLLSFLDSAAQKAEDAYLARYGRLPSGNPKRSVVIFANKAGYAEYSESYGPDSDRFVGHAAQGLSTFYVGNRSREELARTLVHEITHLLNTRALAARLPPWLEEGIASDLGSVWVEASGAVSTGGSAFEGQSWISQGPGSRYLYLAQLLDRGQLPPLEALMGLDREKFYSEALSQFAYSCSLAVIRFFLDADDGRRGDDLREWLRRIAIGRGANPSQLAQDTDGGFGPLNERFRAWVRSEAAEAENRMMDQARGRSYRR